MPPVQATRIGTPTATTVGGGGTILIATPGDAGFTVTVIGLEVPERPVLEFVQVIV